MSERILYQQSGCFNNRREPPLQAFYDALLPFLAAYGVTATFPAAIRPSNELCVCEVRDDEWIGEPPRAVHYWRVQEDPRGMGYDDKYLKADALSNLATGEKLSFKIIISNVAPSRYQAYGDIFLTLEFAGEKTLIEAMRRAIEPVFVKHQFNSVDLEIKPLAEDNQSIINLPETESTAGENKLNRQSQSLPPSDSPEVSTETQPPETIIPEQPARNARFNFLLGAALLSLGILLIAQVYSRLKSGVVFGAPELFFGAVGLIFGGAGLWLFARAARLVRQNKYDVPQYAPIDWQTIVKPPVPIEIKYSRAQDIALVFLIIFFGGLSLLILFGNSLRSANLLITFFLVLILFVVCFLVFRSKRKAARFFDSGGIGRGDGRRFTWNEFRGRIVRTGNTRYGLKSVWRVELVFAGGEAAWIIPQRVKNYREVLPFVDALPPAARKS